MAKYAVIDPQGLPTAFYDEDIHGPIEIPDPNWKPPMIPDPNAKNTNNPPLIPDPNAKPPLIPNPNTQIPKGAILIPDSDWHAHINGDLRKWDSTKKQWVKYTPPPPPLSEVKNNAISELNAIAEQQRRIWLPDVGQALTYLEKEKQAIAYKNAGYTGPIPPLVNADVLAGIYPDAKTAADAIILAAETARTKLTKIEEERRIGIANIQKAKTRTAVKNALNTAKTNILAIK